MDESLPPQSPRVVLATDLVGSKFACMRYGIDRSTLVRRIQSGQIEPLKQLDGPNGAYVFDVNKLPESAA
jgi:hypothetical protein